MCKIDCFKEKCVHMCDAFSLVIVSRRERRSKHRSSLWSNKLILRNKPAAMFTGSIIPVLCRALHKVTLTESVKT